MARSQANIHTSMFDPDSSLMQCSGPAVLLYVALLARQDINLCGVLKYSPASLAARVPGFDADTIELVLAELEDSGHIFVDRQVGEIMVATFMHYDRVLGAAQIVKAAAQHYSGIDSPLIRLAVTEALPPAMRELWPRGIREMSREKVQTLIKKCNAGSYKPDFTPTVTGAFRGPVRGPVRGTATGTGTGPVTHWRLVVEEGGCQYTPSDRENPPTPQKLRTAGGGR